MSTEREAVNAARLTQGTQHTPRFTPTSGTIADRIIAHQLRQRLLSLEYPAFAQCICLLLEALGYEEARPAGRQEWKGYNQPGGGGYDLEAVLPGGLASRRVIAQIKQFDSLRVHQRSVDELRGACLRAGAVEAILVTTSSFSQVVQNDQAVQNAQVTSNDTIDDTGTRGSASTSFAPVRLMDGKELLGLLIQHRLGVQERGKGAAKRLKIDEAFFHTLSTVTTANRKVRDHKGKDCKAKDCTEKRVPLTPHDSSPVHDSFHCPNNLLPSNFRLPKNFLSAKRFVLPSYCLPRWRVTIHIASKGSSRGGAAEGQEAMEGGR